MSDATGHAVEAAHGHDGQEHKATNYYLIWLYLFLLTAAEVGVAMVGTLPKSMIVIALLIMAFWKAALVALYYMHLKHEPARLRLMVMAPLPAVAIMILAIMTEYW